MDEILEALIHSFLFTAYPQYFATPVDVYRLISTICGLFSLAGLIYFFRKFKLNAPFVLLILTSGGMYLFHGYSENYTIVTSFIWIYILFSMESIKFRKAKNLEALLPICFLACMLILLHLVSGYLIFSLIFLCYHFSEDGKFIRNAISCTIFSLIILVPIFSYFVFFSEVRFDFTQTHLTNPKFYPLSKMISLNHFRDILYCIFASSFLPLVLLIYSFIFYRKEVLSLFKNKEFRFLGFVLLGFLIHGFVHFPQLGFPADWDLLTFFWTPLAFLAVFILNELRIINLNSEKPDQFFLFELIPVFIFAAIIFALNGIYLNKSDERNFSELKKSLDRIEQYTRTNESRILSNINPSQKKFYLKVSFFLFESKEKLKEKFSQPDATLQRLIEENRQFQDELQTHITSIDSKWQKDYYSRLTRYNLEYLELLKVK